MTDHRIYVSIVQVSALEISSLIKMILDLVEHLNHVESRRHLYHLTVNAFVKAGPTLHVTWKKNEPLLKVLFTTDNKFIWR